MTDIDSILRADAAGWQDRVDAGEKPGQPTVAVPVARRGHWLVAAAAVVAMFVAMACLALMPDTKNHSAAENLHDNSYIRTEFGRISLIHPRIWLAEAVQFQSAGVIQSLGYLTNGARQPQCRNANPDANQACGGPIDQLRGSEVLATVSTRSAPVDFEASSTIAGRPATVTHAVSPSCPAGTAYGVQARLLLGDSEYQLDFCGVSRDTLAEFDKVINSISYD